MKRTFPSLPLAVLVALAACKPPAEQQQKGLGVRIAEGPSRDVTPAPDGASLAYVADPKPAKELGIRDVSDTTWIGAARFVPAGGGAPVGLGGGVATMPGSIVYSPDGAFVAALTAFSFKDQTGTLVVGDVRRGTTRTVAEKVSFFAFTRDGAKLGWVADETLSVGPSDGALPPVAVVGSASTFEFSPDGRRLLARRKLVADGALLLFDVPSPGSAPGTGKKLGTSVADYNFSPAGDRIAFTARGVDGSYELHLAPLDGEPARLGTGVPSYSFSPDGKHLAFQAGVSPAKQYGDLMLLAAGAKQPAKLGEFVSEVRFAADGSHVAWLEKYDPGSRGGTLAYAKVEAEPIPKKLGNHVPSFLWSRTGAYLAYLQRQLKPVYSVDLYLEKLGAEGPPVKVAQGAFGFDFGRGDDLLYFRSGCVRNGRACELSVVPAARPTEAARKIASGVFTFEFDPAEQRYLMLTYARMDADALDVAVVPADGSQAPKTLDTLVAPGTRWVGKDGDRISYAVIDRKRQGVYVADVEAALAAK